MPLNGAIIIYSSMMFRSPDIIKDEILELKSQFTFRNVGQGLFYTGKIGEFLLVYDCGSLSDKSLRYITHSIEEFHNEVNTDKLGLFVISHFDNDHINGIPELSKRFSKIDTVVIPYIDPASRLLIIANNPKQKSEYYEFLVDPITYLTSRFSIRQLIILSGDNDYRNSETDNLNPTPSDMPTSPTKLHKEFGVEDRVLRNNVQITEDINFDEINSDIFTHSHKGYLQLNAMWKFTFFNYENTDENLKVFLSILKDMGIDCSTKDTLRSIVKDNDKMSKIYESYRDFIKKVKAKDRKNILNVNNTSLVLLHGPINHEGELVNYFHEPKRNLNNIISSQKYKKLLDDSNSAGITKGQLSMLKKRISTIKLTINYQKKRSFKNINRKLVRWPSYNKTILFGDLNATSNMDQIKNHFGRELSEVTTLLVPHHGSKKYWDQNFIKYFNNPLSVWVVNYGVTNTYGHPDPDLVDQLRDFDSTIKLAFNNEIIQIRQHWDVFWTKK